MQTRSGHKNVRVCNTATVTVTQLGHDILAPSLPPCLPHDGDCSLIATPKITITPLFPSPAPPSLQQSPPPQNSETTDDDDVKWHEMLSRTEIYACRSKRGLLRGLN